MKRNPMARWIKAAALLIVSGLAGYFLLSTNAFGFYAALPMWSYLAVLLLAGLLFVLIDGGWGWLAILLFALGQILYSYLYTTNMPPFGSGTWVFTAMLIALCSLVSLMGGIVGFVLRGLVLSR